MHRGVRYLPALLAALALLVAIGVSGLSRDVLDVGGWPRLPDEPDPRAQVLPAPESPPATDDEGRRRRDGGGARRRGAPSSDRGSARTPALRPGLRVRAGESNHGGPRDGARRFVSLGPPDTDLDGLADRTERRIGTSFRRADSDVDAMPDGWEVAYRLDPLLATDAAADSDGDGLTNSTEFRVAASPRSADTDADGRMDGRDDRDGDGVPNLVEQSMAIDPANADSDDDGRSDGAEDHDGDGLPTAVEATLLLDPVSATTSGGRPDGDRDGDGDGVANAQEIQAGTDPVVATRAPAPAPAG